ncbi:MAG: hypothetical protein JW873_04490 [Candidatus Saganbacteria bacterium]|nr:hypothetical protein [Candidatus Saganbacteria bacterium]
MRDSVNVYLKVKKDDLYTLCPFFESFEGMAAVRIPRPAAGEHALLKLMVAPDFLGDFERVLAGLGKKVWYERRAGES